LSFDQRKSLTRKKDGIKINTMEDIRKQIREIIREKGAIRKVAEEIGIAHGNLIRMLREGQDPRIKTIEKIVDRLGYSLTLKKKEVKKGK
jgi:DNA-binding phage protein